MICKLQRIDLIFIEQINFSGGEPFIIDRGNYLGEMVRFCKEDMNMESVTVVTNGSKVMFMGKLHLFCKPFIILSAFFYSHSCNCYAIDIFHKGNRKLDERIRILVGHNGG